MVVPIGSRLRPTDFKAEHRNFKPVSPARLSADICTRQGGRYVNSSDSASDPKKTPGVLAWLRERFTGGPAIRSKLTFQERHDNTTILLGPVE
jgi:hypothetical protein